MDATIEVETPPLHSIGLRLSDGREITPAPDSPSADQPLPCPQPEEREPYTTHPLPCSYPLLWQAHTEECTWLRGVLLTMFTVLTLAMVAVLFSLMIFVGVGIALCVVFLLMNLLRKESSGE
jgi:hypothetical protein